MFRLYADGLEAFRFGPGWAMVRGMSARPEVFASALYALSRSAAEEGRMDSLALFWQKSKAFPQREAWNGRQGIILLSLAVALFSKAMASGEEGDLSALVAYVYRQDERDDADSGPPHTQARGKVEGDTPMANGNKNLYIFMGRLTRDPEEHQFQGGSKVVQMGLATVGQRRKDQATGEWKDEPVFLDCKVFQGPPEKDNRRLADRCMERLSKGTMVYIEGHLILETWEKNGENRQALRLVADEVQFIEAARDGRSPAGTGQGQGSSRQGQQSRPQGGQQRSQGQPQPRGGQQPRQGGQPRYTFDDYDRGDAYDGPPRGRQGGGRPAPEDDIPF